MRANNCMPNHRRSEFDVCDKINTTEYHDIQHVLDVTLAMARMMDGCKRATNDARLDAKMFRLGIIAALYHDAGYIRGVHDTRHKHGAQYTVSHVGRGAVFVESYPHALGMHDEAHQAAQMLHYTGYETPGFYAGATKRLAKDLGNYSIYLEQHFGGDNIYFEELEKNFSHARQIAEKRDMSLLRRSLPETLTASAAAA